MGLNGIFMRLKPWTKMLRFRAVILSFPRIYGIDTSNIRIVNDIPTGTAVIVVVDVTIVLF